MLSSQIVAATEYAICQMDSIGNIIASEGPLENSMEQSTIDEHGLPGIENSDNDGITAATKTTKNKKVPTFTDLMKEIYEKSDNIKIIILEL